MSSATDEASSPNSTHAPGPELLAILQRIQGDGVHRVPEPAVIQRLVGIFVNRSAAVVFHQSANPSLEHGATARFSAASAR